MAVLQAGILHLAPCILMILLTCGFTKANIFKQFPWINKTADQGETVVLHCNGSEDSGEDLVWRKDGNLLFVYSPFINQAVTNYTSSRMSVDPSDPLKLQISNVQPSDAGTYSCFPSRILWILTIK
uniref:Ig-like domain-containing protein n=1 Tax=Astyanax mexicanus TaxID=7994 RepID=A0A3B1JLR4_ASTMX